MHFSALWCAYRAASFLAPSPWDIPADVERLPGIQRLARDPELPPAAHRAPISAAPYGAFPGVPKNGRPSKGIALMATTLTKEPPARPKQADQPPSPPIPVSGLLDITDGAGFVRQSGYQRGPGDVYVPAALIRQHGPDFGQTSAHAAGCC